MIRVMRIAGLILAGLTCAGWAMPQARLWGVHFFAFLPPAISIVLLLAAISSFTPLGAKVVHALAGRLGRLPKSALLWAAFALIVLVAARVREPLLGDGQLLLRHLVTLGRLETRGYTTRDIGQARRTEPGETFLHETAFRVASQFHPPLDPEFTPDQDEESVAAEKQWFFETARWTYILQSAIAGALLVLLSIRLARKALPAPARPLFLLTLFGTSALLLFFGYVEDYAWISLGIVAFLFVAIEESGSAGGWPWKSVAVFAAAVILHVLAVFLLPTLLYLILTRRGASGERTLRWVAACTVIVGIAAYVGLQPWIASLRLLPILPSHARDHYGLLSPEHGADVLNILLLIAPLAMTVLLAAGRWKHFQDHPQRLLALAALGSAAFVLLFDPGLGAPRDWDLYGVALWPLIVLAAWKMAAMGMSPHREELIAGALGFVLLIPLPYVLVNGRTVSAIARYESVLANDPGRAAYGWENLAAYYRRVHDANGAIRALEESATLDPNPRYQLNLAQELRRAGRLEESEPHYLSAAHHGPEYVRYLILLCQDYARRGDDRKAVQVVDTMVRLDPENPIYTRLQFQLDSIAANSQAGK